MHDAAFGLYTALVTQARQPEFYQQGGVADTKEGRFDLILVHAFIVFRRLKTSPAQKELAQQVFDVMFADMDQNMREMGIGDVGILKRIRKMSESYHGRIVAYEEGVAAGEETLGAALNRNLFADTSVSEAQITMMSKYVYAAIDHLSTQEDSALMRGEVSFPAPPYEPSGF
ncbi:tail fiber assembly protein [Thalassospira mesophila]|uniref:Tail fiber assembly protein n=1 Tax=Thalassospira mesophila TaxID=1293891 RepID=A0A1Y2L169_9PROT|nr:tail fiber assembly protein [Thalassospira mesophila]